MKILLKRNRWSLIVKEIEITYDDKVNELIYHGHPLPCLHDEGVCKPTILTPFIIVWLEIYASSFQPAPLVDVCLNSPIAIGLKPNTFFEKRIPIFLLKHLILTLNLGFAFPVLKSSMKYTTQHPDLFITYEEGFDMHTGQRNPLQLPEDEQYYRLY